VYQGLFSWFLLPWFLCPHGVGFLYPWLHSPMIMRFLHPRFARLLNPGLVRSVFESLGNTLVTTGPWCLAIIGIVVRTRLSPVHIIIGKALGGGGEVVVVVVA